MEGANFLRLSNLTSDRMKSLMKMVTKRKDLVNKILFKEQLDGEFQPYRAVLNIARLEQCLRNYNSQTPCSSAASLRDRF